jgi:uncharacterized membrane protein HdeD (DUF308 family)
MLTMGVFIALASLFNPSGSIMHGSDFSWLPVLGFVIILVGVMESIDAYIAKDTGRLFLHLQNGVLDLVVGSLVSFSISGKPDRLSLLLVSYLIAKAVMRIILAALTNFPRRQSINIGAGASIFLGFLIWGEWPSSAAWFMSFCLGADIALRGWSLTQFSHWLKEQAQAQ